MNGGMEIGGFADLATKVAGVAWRLDAGAGGLLLADGEVRGAEAEIAEGDEVVRLRLSDGEASCEAELSARPGIASLQAPEGEPPAGGPLECAPCAATVKLTGAGAGRSLECDGHLSRRPEGSPEGVELIRHLALPAGNRSLLVAAAARPAGVSAHGEEDVSAWLIDAEGLVSGFAETFLSTQYDAEGRQIRVGLELWPSGEESPPLRAAGTRLGGTEGSGPGVSAALLSSSVEGAAGIGSYLIWRR